MDNKPDDINSVRGLLDSQRVADYLGIPRGTIRSWTKRKADGIAGVHASFPDPLPEQLGGTALWDENDIRAFKRVFDESAKKRGRKDDSAADLLQNE